MKARDIIELEDRFQLATYAKLPIAVERGSGCYLWDATGRKYLDFYGGHCVMPLGHCPPAVVEAIREQASKLLFYSNVVYNATRARAAELIVSLAPPSIDRVFFCNSGTEANETALKLARKATGRSRVVAFQHAFHGRTLGSLSVTWNERYRAPYLKALAPTTFVPLNNLDAVRDALGHGDVAAVIVEPIQSMAGMVEAEAGFLTEVGSACRESGTMLIFDEVQTGVGRTGTFSISQQFDVEPDMITMAKSLGSGIPVGAVLVTRDVADTVELADQGTTFGGGMIAMAAVMATLETIMDEGLMDRAAEIFETIESGVAGLAVSVRGRGCLIGIELDRPAKPIIAALREDRILVGSSGDPNVIRLMPPLNTPHDAVDGFLASFRQVTAIPNEASTV